MTSHHEHPSKAAAWRDGALVVHPEAAGADTTVWVGLRSDDGPQWEGLLARSDGDGTATVLAVPYFVYDLDLGDVVETMESAEGALVVLRPLRRSGASTYRVIFRGARDERWFALMRDLEPWSCWLDVRDPGFLAISAPAEHAQAVAAYLSRRERRGELEHEHGR